ncbi:lipopolysaccharide heptosyltransferase II [Calycomorphotria hydatis]|nr:lipopolysaccharide heptosyltransferase II [Calycomorphotria hydatis]
MSSLLKSADPARICLIKPSALGDVVQTLPLLPVLKDRFPKAEIDWVIRGDLAALIEHHPLLTNVVRYERKGGWNEWRSLLATLRQRKYDLTLDLQGLLRTGIMTMATGAKMRIGLQTAREFSSLACHELLNDTSKHVPAHARYWRVAETLGYAESRSPAQLPVSTNDQRWVQEQLQHLPKPLMAVAPGAMWETKRWPVEKFAVVAAKAYRRFGHSAILVGSPGELPLVNELERQLKRYIPHFAIVNLAGKTSLPQLTAVLNYVNVALANDSGPMHLAAAVGTPVTAVFTCTSPARSGPKDKRHRMVQTGVACAGSYKKKCPHHGEHHMSCHAELDSWAVFRAFEQMVLAQPQKKIAA